MVFVAGSVSLVAAIFLSVSLVDLSMAKRGMLIVCHRTRVSHRKGSNHNLAYLILTIPRSYRKFKTNLVTVDPLRCY